MGWNPRQLKYPTGPNCDGCPFRSTSVGFAPPQGITSHYEEGTWKEYSPGPLFASAKYMFVADVLRKDEARSGSILSGGMGGYFNYLLHNYTSLKRPEVVVTSSCRCRPIKWMEKDGKQIPIRQSSGDYVNDKPSPEQVRECHARYGRQELEAFQGHTIIALGSTTLALYAGRGRDMDATVGHIFEPGELLACARCTRSGLVASPRRNCPVCKKRGVSKCLECKRFKHTAKCTTPSVSCDECEGVGTLARPPKLCPDCKGNGEYPKDPKNQYVSKLLKPGQLMFPTYHPTYLMKQPNKKSVVAKHFSRIEDLRGELHVDTQTEYLPYATGIQLDTVYNSNTISIDLETTALDPTRGEIVCIGATDRPSYGVVAGGESSHAYEMLRDAETNEERLIIGQNWSMFDAWWIWKKWGVGLPLRLFDTLLVAHLLDPDSPKKLAHLVHEYANPPIRSYWKTREHYRSDKRTVCAVDVDATLRVAQGQDERLRQKGIEDDYWNEVWPTMRTAFNMRVGGWRVDTGALGIAGARVLARVEADRLELPDWPVTKTTGKRSESQHQEVKKYLYETLRLPVQFERKDKKPTSGEQARKDLLVMLKTGHRDIEHLSTPEVVESVRVLELLNRVQEQSKLLSFLNPEAPDNGYFHPTWDPTGTATFRFACKEPNLQQVPKCSCRPKCYGSNPDCLGARFPFLPDPSHKMASIDYSQVEVVGFLWSAQQWDVLEKVLHQGLDAHAVMAEQLGMHRDEAKNMTFALVYGAADNLIAAVSGKSVAEVAVMRSHYLKIFPGVEDFRSHHINHAMKHGYVENPFGRRRYIWVRSPIGRAANQAANAPIQGIPPMVVRRAMVTLEKELPHNARILGNIHDEIILSYPPEHEAEVLGCAVSIMRSPIPELPAAPLGMAGGLIFNTDVEVGTTWASLQTYTGDLR